MKKGKCYESAYKAMCKKYPILVHGIVTGTMEPIKGKKFGHAWLEYDDENGIRWCFDTESGKHIPQVLYYHVGNVEYTSKYDVKTALIESLRVSTYGPWDDKIFNVDDEV